jgi:hypothetical protein
MLCAVPQLAAVPDLERELDDLYARPLDEFTKARNDLAARLRKAHQAEAAAEIRALKKPSVVAWSANMLARAHPDLIGELLAAGDGLRRVQQQALGGGDEAAAALPAAFSREREAVGSLVAAARRELGGRASAPTLDRLAQTRRAAAVDPAAAATLAAGRLTDELAAVGFGPPEAVEPRATKAEESRHAARERVNALRAEARRLAGEARAAERTAHDAERDASRLRAEAEAKAADADRAAAELAAAEEALRTAG